MKIHRFLTLNVKLSQASESSLLCLMPPTQDVNYSSYGRTQAKEKKTGAERLRCAEAVVLFPTPAGEASIILFPSFQLQPAQNSPNSLYQQFRHLISISRSNLQQLVSPEVVPAWIQSLKNPLPLLPASHELQRIQRK